MRIKEDSSSDLESIQILERYGDEKPKLNLTPIRETAVHVPTIEDYLELRMVWKFGGWKWNNLELPKGNDWRNYKEEMCIDANIDYGYADREFYLQNGWNVISKQEFYNKQELRITPEVLKEISQSFEGIPLGAGKYKSSDVSF